MSLLIDRLREAGLFTPPKGTAIIKANNVADYYYLGSEKEEWDTADMPNIAPPFPLMWLEWRKPDHSNSGGKLVRIGPSSDYGIYIHSYNTDQVPKEIQAFVAKNGVTFPDNTRWVCLARVFIGIPGTATVGSMCKIMWCVDAAGAYTSFVFNGVKTHKGEGGKGGMCVLFTDAEKEILQQSIMVPNGYTSMSQCVSPILQLTTHIPLLAISFFHCRNVELRAGEKIPHALQHSRAARGKPPLYRHYTLLIDPMKKVIAGATKEGSLSAKALHICRGHFKDYRDHGLFGRNHGLYWWGMHTRGDAAAGTVEKNYDVKA